jgi:hypothetical protein
MGSHSKRSCSTYSISAPIPPPPIPDFIASGVTIPETAGNYFIAGILNEKIYARREDGLRFMWYDFFDNEWVISIELGTYQEIYFAHFMNPPEGIFTPHLEAVGSITVVLGH